MKTRTEYQTEKKRLKVPKVEEFTISFTDGVSERLKVRINTFVNFLLTEKNMLHFIIMIICDSCVSKGNSFVCIEVKCVMASIFLFGLPQLNQCD